MRTCKLNLMPPNHIQRALQERLAVECIGLRNKRAAGAPPMGALREGPMPQMVSLEGLDANAQPAEHPEKKPR